MMKGIRYIAALTVTAACWRVYSGTTPQPDGPVYAQIIFTNGTAAIHKDDVASLTNVAWTLRMWPGSVARIEGHAATSEGLDGRRMMKLSEKRANAVFMFLRTTCGLSNVLEVVGYSDSRPKIQRGRPDEGKNARVEVYIRAPIERFEGPE